jgi:hypothetical protein
MWILADDSAAGAWAAAVNALLADPAGARGSAPKRARLKATPPAALARDVTLLTAARLCGSGARGSW